jgi:hypothetical protein
MPNKTFIPSADKDKAVWLKNFANKIGVYQPTLGLTAAEVASVQSDSAIFTYTIDMVEVYKNESQKRVSFKNILGHGEIGTPLPVFPANPTLTVPPALVAAGIFKRLAKLVQKIKNSASYNDSIGQDLGIIAPEGSIDTLAMKPDLKGALDAGRPLIKWKKKNASSIDIYVDRKDGKGFIFLANDSQPDYLDTFELPAAQTSAVWDYRGIYRIGDEQVGDFSEGISITVTRKVAFV